jgi:hypothetical protein
MQTQEAPAPAAGDVAASAEQLKTVRRERAELRRQQRAYLDAMEDEAKRRLATVFVDDDPITGRPVCLLVKSDGSLDDAYENQTPRPIPDSPNRLTVEILGRALVVEVDDFGRATVTGVAGAGGLTRIAFSGSDVVFLGKNDTPETSHTTFAALLSRLIDDVVAQERQAAHPADDDAA